MRTRNQKRPGGSGGREQEYRIKAEIGLGHGLMFDPNGIPMVATTHRTDGDVYAPVFPVVDSEIGRQRITDVTMDGDYLSGVRFSNGKLPKPLCPFCAGLFKSEPRTRDLMIGSMLVGMSWKDKDEEEPAALFLHFELRDGREEQMPIHLNSVLSLGEQPRATEATS